MAAANESLPTAGCSRDFDIVNMEQEDSENGESDSGSSSSSGDEVGWQFCLENHWLGFEEKVFWLWYNLMWSESWSSGFEFYGVSWVCQVIFWFFSQLPSVGLSSPLLLVFDSSAQTQSFRPCILNIRQNFAAQVIFTPAFRGREWSAFFRRPRAQIRPKALRIVQLSSP